MPFGASRTRSCSLRKAVDLKTPSPPHAARLLLWSEHPEVSSVSFVATAFRRVHSPLLMAPIDLPPRVACTASGNRSPLLPQRYPVRAPNLRRVLRCRRIAFIGARLDSILIFWTRRRPFKNRTRRACRSLADPLQLPVRGRRVEF